MFWKVDYLSYEKLQKGEKHKGHIGKEVYRHPKNRFVVLEFQGKMGRFRESFRPQELKKVGLFI